MKKETISNILSTAVSLCTGFVICDWIYEKGRKQGFSEGQEQGYEVGKLMAYSDCLRTVTNRTKPKTKEENESE